ncbi:MAG: hypothetical protein V3S39_04325, partial [Thermodesulfobacteriota bacterium]
IPGGTLIGAEGVFVFDAARCTALGAPSDPCFSARVVEALFIADLGGGGFVSIQRAQCKTGKNEMRVRGSATPDFVTVRIIDTATNDVLATGIAIDPATNEWEFRGTPDTGSCPAEPAIIVAITSLEEASDPFDMVISN